MEEDFEEDYKDAVEAGQKNLRAKQLLNNWCYHAEFVRSSGRGMIEETTGLPIGHMGVQCKFSKKNTMMCWVLEDAAYDFYLNNCKDCSERVPVGNPNIMDFVRPREEAAEKRRKEQELHEIERKQERAKRQRDRAEIRYELSLEETFVVDLLDELDQEDISGNDPRLEQLANLAPESFTRRIIEHLMPLAVEDSLPYSASIAKALLGAKLKIDEQLSVAVRLITFRQESPEVIEIILKNADKLSPPDLKKILWRFVSMAIEPPPHTLIGRSRQIILDAEPIKELLAKRRNDICEEVESLINDPAPEYLSASIQMILATDDDDLLSKYTRSIFAKLMRRRTLLRGERRDSSVLYYIRKAATKSLERFPEKSDRIIQGFLEDRDETGRKEALRTYSSVLKHNLREKAQIGTVQRIAFRRLLWASVENPDDGMDDAAQFFRYARDEFAELAVEHLDDLIGAAATLSEQYEQVDADCGLELSENFLTQMEKSNKRNAINGLQEALIEWAAIGAKLKGTDGINEFLDLYKRLPTEQTLMRGSMILHVSKLLSGVESLTLILSDWYSALMDENALVRARALQAWENVPYELVDNFPDLFLETFSILLADSYVIVHRSAVHALRRRAFPKEKRNLIRGHLLNLITCYSGEHEKDDFIVDCIDTLAFLCLTSEEKNGRFGQFLSEILLSLEGGALYKAVDSLHYGFSNAPKFVKVALKSIQSDYTRSISIDDCASAILRASRNELLNSVDDIKIAFESLKPFRREDFREALLYIAVLTKAKKHKAAADCLEELLSNIPAENRSKQWRIETALVKVASEVEDAIAHNKKIEQLTKKWSSLSSDLSLEYEERTKLRDFPPSFFPQS